MVKRIAEKHIRLSIRKNLLSNVLLLASHMPIAKQPNHQIHHVHAATSPQIKISLLQTETDTQKQLHVWFMPVVRRSFDFTKTN